ncbi:uracil phosphoribosyltransferase [Butyricicoccus sp.]|uniref:uracil phosphoribosyltransferase n=1 Tax=Butyricicoccus sp. TaxID=2049021 RepID=UPI003F151EA2
MAQVHVINHPLIVHKLSLMRDKYTGPKEFREAVEEISSLLCYEATRDLPLKEVEIETPIAQTKVKFISGKKLAVVCLLRAGLGMVDGVLDLIPNAKIGHIGMYRDPDTMQPVEYYCKLPTDIASRDVIVVDPMLATGGSAIVAIQFLKNYGVQNIKLLSILAVPESISAIQEEHPDVDIFCASVDEKLNEKGYIVPGMGDAGDRLFGTK